MFTASGIQWILADGTCVGVVVGGRTEVMSPLRWWRLRLYVLCVCVLILCSVLATAACLMQLRRQRRWWEDRGHVSLVLVATWGMTDSKSLGAIVGQRTDVTFPWILVRAGSCLTGYPWIPLSVGG